MSQPTINPIFEIGEAVQVVDDNAVFPLKFTN